MNSLLVRLADLTSAADCEAVIGLLDMYCRDEFGDGQPISDIARENLIPGLQQHSGGLALLAFEGAAAVGLAICFVGFSSFKGQPLLNIHDLAVAPSARGKGVGRALLQAIDREAIRRGCCKVTLEVRSDNQRAQALYRAEGFAGSQPQSWFWSKTLPASHSPNSSGQA